MITRHVHYLGSLQFEDSLKLVSYDFILDKLAHYRIFKMIHYQIF